MIGHYGAPRPPSVRHRRPCAGGAVIGRYGAPCSLSATAGPVPADAADWPLLARPKVRLSSATAGPVPAER